MTSKIEVNVKNSTTKKTKLPLSKFWNKLFWSNLAFCFGLIMLIFSIVFSENVHSGSGQMIGNIVCSSLIIFGSLVFTILFVFLMYKKGQKPGIKNLQLASSITALSVPLIGSIVVFIWKTKEKKIDNKKSEKKDASFKKPKSFIPSSFTILFILTLFVILIIWIVNVVTGGIYNGDTSEWYVVPGVLDLFIAPMKGFVDAADLVVFLLIMGGFLQIVNDTKSLEAGVGALVKKMKGKEIWLIPILILLFSIGGTTFGMCEETLPFFLIVIPIMVAGGFDVMTGFLVIVFGAGLGVAGSIINPFVINTAVDAANFGAGSTIVEISDGIVWRVVGYLTLVAVGMTCVTLYAKKVKKNPSKSVVYWNKKELDKAFKFDNSVTPELTRKRKAVLWIFGSTFLVMIIMVISWGTIIPGFVGFEELNTWLATYFPYLSSNGAIGTWYLVQMSFLFFVAAIIISIINWSSEENFLKSFFVGVKDFIGVAAIIAVARGLSLILVESGVNNLIVDGLQTMFTGMNNVLIILLLFFIFIGLSFLIPSTSGFASAVFPSIGPALAGSTVSVSGAITTFSYASGMVNIMSPTSPILVAGLGLSKITLVDFYKGAYKYLGIFMLTCIALIIIGVLLPTGLF